MLTWLVHAAQITLMAIGGIAGYMAGWQLADIIWRTIT